MSTLHGITPHGSSTPTKIKQYADDTCFYINEVTDIYTSLDIVDTFCKASGMVINLDKTDLMYLGQWIKRPPILPQPLSINIVDPDSLLRYLGVMIGNTIPKDIAWTRVKSKVVDTIARNQINRPTLTERTLVANSVVTGNMLYGVAHSYIHENTLIQMDKISQLAVTNRNTMILPLQALTANREHGILVPYIPPLKLFRALNFSEDYKQNHCSTFYRGKLLKTISTIGYTQLL